MISTALAEPGVGFGRRAALSVLAGASVAALTPADAFADGRRYPAPPAWRNRRQAPSLDARRVCFLRRDSGEGFSGVYYADGRYHPEALAEIDWVLRDLREDAAAPIDRALIDLMSRVCRRLDGMELLVTSGFRTPETNKALIPRGAARRSLHLQGRAVDFYSPQVSARRLARLVAAEGVGGVGLYQKRGFVHADVGEVRYWRV